MDVKRRGFGVVSAALHYCQYGAKSSIRSRRRGRWARAVEVEERRGTNGAVPCAWTMTLLGSGRCLRFNRVDEMR
jgi:hypothetical protein